MANTRDEATEVPEDGSLRKGAARGSAITLVGQITRILIQLLSVILLARLIPPADFGLYAMVLAVSGVAQIFLDLGFSMAALRSRDLTKQQHSNLFWINTSAGFLLFIIIFSLAIPLATFYGDDRLIRVTQWISIVYLLGGITAQFRVHLNRHLRFGALSLADVLAPLVALVVAVIMAMKGYGVQALVVQTILNYLVMLVLVVVMARWVPSFPRKTPGMKPLLTFGMGLGATRFLSYLTQNIDSIIIGRVMGPVQLGFYDRAFRLAVAPVVQISFPFTRVTIPFLVRVMDDGKKYVAALREAQMVGIYGTASFLLVFGGMATPIVTLIFGPDWVEAGLLMTILCIGAIFRTLQQVATWVFMSKGLSGALLKLNLVMQPVIVLLIIGGARWGTVGVAWAGTLGYFLFWLVSIAWASYATNLNLWSLVTNPLEIIGKFSLPAGLITFAISSNSSLSLLTQFLASIGGALIWFVFIYCISKKIKKDIRRLVGIGMLVLKRR